MKQTLTVTAALLVASASILFALQRGGGRGGALPGYYTNKTTPLAPVDTSAADRACQSSTGHAKLVCLADLLKRGVAPALASRLQLPYSVADGRRWSNLPPQAYQNRVGVSLGELGVAELGVVKAIVKAAAGIAVDEGYDEIDQILNADDFLKNNATGTGFASGNYQIAFLGSPAPTGTWQLYFGGHHLAVSSTYTNGVMVGATPSFRGVEPFTAFRENGRENGPMLQEQAAFAAMIGGLSADQQAKAKLPQTFTDILAGAQRDDNIPSIRAGIKASELGDAQRALVMRAVETYVGDIAAAESAKVLAKYRAELPETYVAFSGTAAMNTENDYVRIDGPSVWIEFSIQPGRSLPGIHPHSIWRDRASDYGGNK